MKAKDVRVLDAVKQHSVVNRSYALYTVLIPVVAIGSSAYGLRRYGIFRCPASGYVSAYLGYCGGENYGDYDHGAFRFGLEPEAIAAAVNANVLFIGNSRTMFGFSSETTAGWFVSEGASYYLLGFSHVENRTFEVPLMHKLRLKPKAYIINVDSFFASDLTGPGRTVMSDASARTKYEQKRLWQGVHKRVCATVPILCGNGVAYFRIAPTGAWLWPTARFVAGPVSYKELANGEVARSHAAAGEEFLRTIPVSRECIILTIVPSVETETGTAKAVARALHLDLIAPQPAELNTFDGSHLDYESAERWSKEFFDKAGPRIQQCLSI